MVKKDNTIGGHLKAWLKEEKSQLSYALKFLENKLSPEDYDDFFNKVIHEAIDNYNKDEHKSAEYLKVFKQLIDKYAMDTVIDKVSDIIDDMPALDIIEELKCKG